MKTHKNWTPSPTSATQAITLDQVVPPTKKTGRRAPPSDRQRGDDAINQPAVDGDGVADGGAIAVGRGAVGGSETTAGNTINDVPSEGVKVSKTLVHHNYLQIENTIVLSLINQIHCFNIGKHMTCFFIIT